MALPNQQSVEYPSFKLVIVGDGGTGKTTFVKRHLTGEFEKKYEFHTKWVGAFHKKQNFIDVVEQKIIMKVQMNCEKCRTKAMKIAAVAEGVISVAIEREKSLVVVVGDGVDSVSLAGSLRKKLGSANIESVQEVKAESAEKKDPIIWYSQYPQYPTYAVVSDQYTSNCAIM